MARRGPTASRAVTLADVARHAGVSPAVVSYVVNDGPRAVAPATRERVRESLDLLGYRPNSHARALMSGKIGILGLIHPGTANPFFGEYCDVMFAAAARSGTALLMATSNGRAEVERELVESLANRNVDGIISMTSMGRDDVTDLRDPGIPMIFVNCPYPVPGYTTIGPDAAGGAHRLVDHLVEVHRHREIAFVAGEHADHAPDDRELGWREAMRRHGRPAALLARAPFTMDGGYGAATRLLDGQDPPTAVFASSDLQAIGVLHALHERGLRVPDDVAVVSFDGTAEAGHTWPPLTLVQQPLVDMADAALTSMLEPARPRHMLFEMRLVVRRSCGCRGDA